MGGEAGLANKNRATGGDDSPSRDPVAYRSHSATGRRWVQRQLDERQAQALSQRLNVPDFVGRVLAARGVTAADGADYLSPSLKSQMPDPSSIRDMDKAIDVIVAALRANRKIAVFGDYDVDGATSSALFHRYFSAIGQALTLYIPDRIAEGYGPNAPALQKLRNQGIDLVITVDCGVSSFDALQSAASIGLQVVVVDHHVPGPSLPPAAAVVDPNRLDDCGELGHLAAVGLCFMLLVALNRKLRQTGYFENRPEPNLLQWLDLVALGTVADVVPLTGLNRAYVQQGLKQLHKRGNPGLAALSDIAGMQERAGAYHLGFVLGPRINAGGRVGEAALGTQLLIAPNREQADPLAVQLDSLNRERQEIEKAVLDEAEILAAPLAEQGQAVIFVASAAWHAGVIGIVASRLKDRFHRPALVLALADGIAKGSGRSVPGVDLGAVVLAAKQAGLLVAGGGHPMAAGLTVAEDKLGELQAFLNERIARQLTSAPSPRELAIDGLVRASGATRELYDQLEQAGPYGAGHPEPRLVIPRVQAVKADIVGKGHLRLIVAPADGKGRLKAIAFNAAGGPIGELLLGQRPPLFDLAGHLRADDWGGRRGVQMIVEDIGVPDAE